MNKVTNYHILSKIPSLNCYDPLLSSPSIHVLCFLLIYNNRDLCTYNSCQRIFRFFDCFYHFHFSDFDFIIFLLILLKLFILWTYAFVFINNYKQKFKFNSRVCHIGKLNAEKREKTKLEAPHLPRKSFQYLLLVSMR